MTKTLQLLRGTTAQNNSFTGHAGELTVDTTTNELRLHDGSTAGGFTIPKKSDCQGLLGGGTSGTLLTNSGTAGTVNSTSIDATPTDGSNNPVSSDGVYDALATKADTATTLSGYGITDGANTNLSNLTSTGKAVVANLPMPSGTYIDLTPLGASGASYTAPADGYVSVHGWNDSNSTGSVSIINGKLKATSNGGSGEWGVACVMPVKKGGSYKISYANITNWGNCCFVYANGEA